jgi:glycosyltransferase involved in cell wall biosynthesis
MKILHVEAGRHLYGGARQVAYILEGLRARGIENLLACPPGSDIAAAAAPFAQVLPIAMGGDADAGMALRLAALIRRHRPDLLHLHSRRGADVWGGIAACVAGVRCVLSRRVDNPEPRWLAGLKYRLYDHVITISEGIRAVLLGEGLAPRKVSCVRSALDATPWLVPVDRAAFCAEFGLPADALTIGMAAQLIPRKGHRYLLDALPALCARFPTLQVLMFGKGPLEGALRDEIAAHGLGDRVQLAGFRDDLPRWLGGLDVLAHPADMEGLGIALLQAAAAAVPVVASRAGGLPEAVEDGVTGILVPPGDVATLGAALAQLLADAPLRQRLGAAGRARILAEFSINAMVEGNLAVYRKVLAQ